LANNLSLFLLFTLLVTFTGCGSHRDLDAAWRKARPLGQDIKTYRPPRDPSQVDGESTGIKEPTGVITLRQTLAQALLKNPGLAAFSWEIRAGEARTLQAGLLPNPELEAELEQFGGTNQYTAFDGAQTTIMLSQLIPLAGKISKRVKTASLERDLAGWDYEIKRLDVLTETTKAFVAVLAAQEQLALSDELVHLSEQVLDTVSKRVKAGKVSPLQQTKAEVVLSTGRIQLGGAKRNLKAARNRLAAAWNSTSPAFEKVEGRLDTIKPIPSADQLAGLVSQNPDIVRWITEIELRGAALELEKAMVFPDPTVSAGMQRFEESSESGFAVGISIPLPLFDRNQGGVLEAHYKQVQAVKWRRDAEVRARTAFVKAYQDLSFFYMEATALKSDVLPAAQSAFDAASEGYRYGKFGYLDVLDAQRTLFETKGHSIEAMLAYHQAVADVERLIGAGLDSVGKNQESEEE